MYSPVKKPKGEDKLPETDRREYPRIRISRSVDYVCLDDKYQKIEEGKGKVLHILNISQGGVLMETPKVINSKNILIVTIDLEGSTIKIGGEVIHSRKLDPNGALTGIRFVKPYTKQRDIIAKFIKAHYYRGETA
jgi:c-di-GMP-binding flagellar brake protein YcgR